MLGVGLWDGTGQHYKALLRNAQLGWCGHVIPVDDTRIPKQVFCGQLVPGVLMDNTNGTRTISSPH